MLGSRWMSYHSLGVRRSEFAIYILKEIMEVHSLVALKLVFVERHCLSMNPSLLPLPFLRVSVELEFFKLPIAQPSTFEIKCCQSSQSLYLLPQNHNLVFTPRKVGWDLHGVSQVLQLWQRLDRDQLRLILFFQLLQLFDYASLSLEFFVSLE